MCNIMYIPRHKSTCRQRRTPYTTRPTNNTLKILNFNRHAITQLKLSGEAAAVNTEVVNNFRDSALKTLIHGYDISDVYNGDETGLFFKCLPDKTLAYRNEKCHGGKNSKERITVMPIVNWSGK